MTMIGTTKICRFADCRKVMRREDYPTNKMFRVSRYCSSSCGQQARYRSSWKGIMEFEVVPGVELTYDEIGDIGRVSKQACQQLAERAMEKLAKNPEMQILALAVIDMQGTEWRCAK